MNHNVFISFSSKDIETAIRIHDGLTNRGVKCWISSKHVSPGGDYQTEIVNALAASCVMVLVYSQNANSSLEIPKEIALAGQYQLTVIPLKIDDVIPSGGFMFALATSQWVNVFPDIEMILDNVALQINSLTGRIEKFTMQVRQALEEELEEERTITTKDQEFLGKIGVGLGLTISQSRAVIKSVIGTPLQSLKERELVHLKIINEVLEDRKISSIEKWRLKDSAKSLGISDVRAQELLDQEMIKLQMKEIIVPPPVESESAQPPGNCPTPPEDISWPAVGYKFLNAIKENLDVALLPFTPTWVADFENIDTHFMMSWSINEKHFIGIWFDTKSKRKDKVSIFFGYYSINKRNDPLFRNSVDRIIKLSDSLDEEGYFSLSEHRYLFNSGDYLALETSDRVTFAMLLDSNYMKTITHQISEFAKTIWPAISVNYAEQSE